MSLSGKVAIVTGAARGIGRSYAEGLAKAGAAVLIVDLLDDLGKRAVEAMRAKDQKAAFLSVDVSDMSATESMARYAVDQFGGIDILVNNAAMFSSLKGGPMADISVERWDRTMAVNVRGPWLCTRAVVPWMRNR